MNGNTGMYKGMERVGASNKVEYFKCCFNNRARANNVYHA